MSHSTAHPSQQLSAPEKPRGIVVNPRARSLNPHRGGLRYGNSFLSEREISAAEARHQAKVATLERAMDTR